MAWQFDLNVLTSAVLAVFAAAIIHLLLISGKKGTSPRVAGIGTVLMAYGSAAITWLQNEVLVKVPTNLNDEAFALAFLALPAAYTTLAGSGILLVVIGARQSVGKISWTTLCWAVLPTTLLTVCLALMPFAKVATGSLVVENGKILPFGSPYKIIPGFKTSQIGLNNSFRVSYIKPEDKEGGLKTVFLAKVKIRAQPGDLVALGFDWKEFQENASEWFKDELGSDIEERSKAATKGVYIKKASLKNPRTSTILGIRIWWDGAYWFNPSI